MIIETAKCKIKAGSEDEFVALFPDFEKGFLTVAGCKSLRMFRDQKDASTFILIMEFDDQSGLDGFRVLPAQKAWGGAAGPLFDGKPDVAFYESI